MNYKNIDSLIQVLKKIKLPSSPKKRMMILKIIIDLENAKILYESLKKTYESDELISLEQQKYNFVKQFESTEGVMIYNTKVMEKDIPIISEHIQELNENKIYKEYLEFLEFSENELVQVGTLQIDDLPDDIFEKLESHEIELLTKIIS